jgi:hypothetical protein
LKSEAKSEPQPSAADSLDAMVAQLVVPESLGKMPLLDEPQQEEVVPKKIIFS